MSEKKAEAKRSWRDVYPVHPAADIFPMLPEDELRKLGEDIEANGLREPIALFRPHDDADAQRICIVDGRNRLAAIELTGGNIDPNWPRSGGFPSVKWIDDAPESYVISKNIRRRHLTKEQQADLIVKVMEARNTDRAKLARSVKRDSSGRVQGSTKDPIKERIVQEAKKHGISERTVKRSLAKARGPNTSRRVPEKEPDKEKSKAADNELAKIKRSVDYICREVQRILGSMREEQGKLFIRKLVLVLARARR